MTTGDNEIEQVDAVIVGAGFAGMYMLHRLRGLGLTTVIIEAAPGVGGTWFWNSYPGARVDIESRDYGYSFDPELERDWRWTERYAAQPELLRYLNHVADRYDLRRDIRFNTRVAAAHWDDSAQRWTVRTDSGEAVSSRYCVMATGCLSEPKDLDFAGTDDFKGESYRTFGYPQDGVDYAGKRVGIIGTGSSAVQTITTIAGQCVHLTVFQRTPNYCAPAHNHPLSDAEQAVWDSDRESYRARAKATPLGFFTGASEALILDTPPVEVESELERRWEQGGLLTLGAYADTGVDMKANAVIADYAARKIANIVENPALANKLTPKTYPYGTKRLCVDTGYYEVWNQENMTLVDINETPIERITATGIQTSDAHHELDAIIYATGFDAMTGTLAKIDITGRGGLPLADKWRDGPVTLLGLMIAGFPNFFTITGPGSPSVLTNMVMSIEQHVDWIAEAIDWLGTRQLGVIEAEQDAETAWVAHVREVAEMTLMSQANSWYMGANVPGKPRVFTPYIGGLDVYSAECARIAEAGYEGFKASAAA